MDPTPCATVAAPHGGDLMWIGWGGLAALDVAVQEDRQDFADWLRTKGTKGAKRASELSA